MKTDRQLLDDYCTEIHGVGHKAFLTVESLINSHRKIRQARLEQDGHIKYLHERSEADIRKLVEQETRQQYAEGLRGLAGTFREMADEIEKMAAGTILPFT